MATRVSTSKRQKRNAAKTKMFDLHKHDTAASRPPFVFIWYISYLRPDGEVVTQRSAKPLCAGSIPARASRRMLCILRRELNARAIPALPLNVKAVFRAGFNDLCS